MPIDSEPDNSSGSNKVEQGWLAKCGLLIPSLSVRGRHSPEEDPNRLVMSLTDYKDKKRKRTSRSPMPVTRSSLKMKTARKTSVELFQAILKNKEAHARYAENRQQLLQDEEATSWDLPARQSASEAEIKAGQIIWKLREFERDVLFGNIPSEAIPGPKTLDMGGQFLTNKSRIEGSSKIFEIAKDVPKGALLHLHFNAELNPGRLLEEARSMPNMFIRSLQSLLTQDDLDKTEMVFKICREDTPSYNIFSPNYKDIVEDPVEKKPMLKWMRWSEFREEFVKQEFSNQYRQEQANSLDKNGPLPNSSEQGEVSLDEAENWIRGKMVISEEEAYGMKQTVNGVWARFNQATRNFKGLIGYEKVYRWYISTAIDRMIEEHVMYAELRPMLMDKDLPKDDGKEALKLEAQMELIVECLKEKKAQLKSEGKLDRFPFGLKIIYCTPRSIGKERMQTEIEDCIKLKEKFEDLICGFDLVGAEDRPNHIGHYYEELVALEETCKAKDLDIPFLFHAGETLLDTGGSKDPGKSNLYDAVLLKSKRIGHGFSLLKHPQLIDKFKRKSNSEPGICIELCPISNELLHLCRNIKEHPYPELLAAGIPCTINSDNPSLFSNSMSHEFYQIMVGAPAISIHSWKQLARWSLEYSCLSEEQKKEAYKIFEKDWEKFCEGVVDKYGKLFVEGEDVKAQLARLMSAY
ncbi:Metallo-dependent hydrolase [Lindgomyces ingoldianus]|uniref:Metallo-dependent hydrolase n=1 Tax=Lindgomyces ingoldianus TaxID=673940 RepID=A0ACB6QGP8_9PLEO|nr:Metallo-dependent hydrolase [Lindgomyces ingoldianus]KAF2466065.1 Metallo-dependent hydrolase [Lindgomyces ingoldianus]